MLERESEQEEEGSLINLRGYGCPCYNVVMGLFLKKKKVVMGLVVWIIALVQ